MSAQQIINAVNKCVVKADAMYGTKLTGRVQVKFNKRSINNAATAIVNNFLRPADEREYILKFNQHLVGAALDELLADTVPHEVAHLVNFYDPSTGWNHNAGWVRVCKALGGTGQRVFGLGTKRFEALKELRIAKLKKTTLYAYKTWSGGVMLLSNIRHKRIQAGKIYMSDAGRIDKNGYIGQRMAA